MAFLTIASIDVSVLAPTGPKLDPLEIGETARAFGGSLRVTVRDVKRVWDMTTTPMLIADANALFAAIPIGGIVNVTGNFVDGATVSAKVTVKTNYRQIGEKTTHRRVLDIHIEEV